MQKSIFSRRRENAKIPLFVLTGKRTFSGGEEFTYNMQTQKRATLIGQITGN
jgi:C-terminal processing protease CtpA/Prc